MTSQRFLVAVCLSVCFQCISCQDESLSLSEVEMKSEGIHCTSGPERAAELVAVDISQQPSYLEELAANKLRQYLLEFFGADLPLSSLDPSSETHMGRILVGKAAVEGGQITEQELTSVGEGGYVVRAKDGCVAIAGNTTDGTLSGVYAFLEEAGARFLSADSFVAPQKRNYIVPEMSISREPAFKFRSDFSPYQAGYTHDHVIGNPKELGSKQSWVHTADFLLSYEKYHQEHPEYFALMKDGRRLTPDPDSWRFDVHVCMSNPEVRRVAAENLLQWVEAQPDRKYFMVSQGDGRGDKWCQCDQCQAMDAVPGKVMTDRLLDFVNHLAREVAKQYPDKILFTLSYTEATGPVPVRVKPDPNVRVMYCPYPWDWGCQSHAFCEQNQKGMKDLADWIKLCPKQLFIFDYSVGYKMPLEVFGSFYAMVEKIQYYGRSGIEGLQFCGSPRNFNSLFKYVMDKLLWDPEIDVEKTIDEFMTLYYGCDTGPFMREYFDLIYSEIRERPVHQMCEGNNPSLVTAELAEKGYGIFERALSAAGNDDVVRNRIEDEELFLLFSDLQNHNKVNGLASKNMAAYAKKLAEFTRLARERQVTSHERRKPMREFYWNTAKIRFEGEPWYNDAKVDQFLADPISMLQ